MRVELHAHTNAYSACSPVPPEHLAAVALAMGYDALFLTEHHRVWPERDLARVQESVEGLTLFPGIEITVEQGVDILVLGAQDPVYEDLKTPDEVFAQACRDGLPAVVVHPYRWADAIPDFCKLADALEVRSCHHFRPEQVDAAHAYAETHGQAPVYAGDVHGLNYLNRFLIDTHEDFGSAQELRRLLLMRRYDCLVQEGAETELPLSHKIASLEELAEPSAAE